MRRATSLGLLTVLLVATLFSIARVQPVESVGTIYIRADGSIDPPTAHLTTTDNVTYTLTDDVHDSIVVERNNIVIDGRGFTLQGNGSRAGIDLPQRTNVTVKNTKIEAFYWGVRLYYTSASEISGNNVTNSIAGILLDFSSDNSVYRNSVTNNTAFGLLLFFSSHNTIYENNLMNSSRSIGLYSSPTNHIYDNDIVMSDVGISLENLSSDNRFYHNNFIDNDQQVRFYSYAYANVWDSSYPSGGNYWSDHNPPDAYSGMFQNETGSDGIGDWPYTIDLNNQDDFPLIYPYGHIPSPDINNDGVVDVHDLVLVAITYGSEPGFPIWNPYCDLNQDGVIDIFDLVPIALTFGHAVS